MRSREDFPTLEEVEVVAAATEELEETRSDLPKHLQRGRIRRLLGVGEEEAAVEGAGETPDKTEPVL